MGDGSFTYFWKENGREIDSSSTVVCSLSSPWSDRPPIILQYSRRGEKGKTRVKESLGNENGDHSGARVREYAIVIVIGGKAEREKGDHFV